jgi:pyroglutamyl-peptidase
MPDAMSYSLFWGEHYKRVGTQRKCDSMEDMTVEQAPKSRVKNSRKSTQTLLLTGFEPFGDDPGAQKLNPSAAIAQALHGEIIAGLRVRGAVLPCVYGLAAKEMRRLIKTHQPKAIVCLGQAGGRAALSIERIAVNWDEACLPDNAGRKRTGQPILKTAPAAYFSTLPIHAMRDAVLAQGLPAELSSSAGHFVCNHVFFSLMHMLATSKLKRPAGFIHLPYLPEQAQATQQHHMPSMSQTDMLCALRFSLLMLRSEL